MRYVINTHLNPQKVIVVGDIGTDALIVNLIDGDVVEQLNSDYVNEHFGSLQDDAYQRGLEDGKQTAVGAAELREKLEYQKGFKDGKAIHEKGCEGCKWEGDASVQAPCSRCCNYYRNRWKAKDDKIVVGDEVNAEDGTAVFTVTWMSENCICGVDEGGKCYAYEPQEICGKTGRHFDIDKILDEMKGNNDK